MSQRLAITAHGCLLPFGSCTSGFLSGSGLLLRFQLIGLGCSLASKARQMSSSAIAAFAVRLAELEVQDSSGVLCVLSSAQASWMLHTAGLAALMCSGTRQARQSSFLIAEVQPCCQCVPVSTAMAIMVAVA